MHNLVDKNVCLSLRSQIFSFQVSIVTICYNIATGWSVSERVLQSGRSELSQIASRARKPVRQSLWIVALLGRYHTFRRKDIYLLNWTHQANSGGNIQRTAIKQHSVIFLNLIYYTYLTYTTKFGILFFLLKLKYQYLKHFYQSKLKSSVIVNLVDRIIEQGI